jgi:RecA/RadA recombinase
LSGRLDFHFARIVVIDAFAAQTAREEIRGAFVASTLEARQEVARYGPK